MSNANSMFSTYIQAADRLAKGIAKCDNDCPVREAFWKHKYVLLYNAIDRITYNMDSNYVLEEEFRKVTQETMDRYADVLDKINLTEHQEREGSAYQKLKQSILIFFERCKVRFRYRFRFFRRLFPSFFRSK